MKTLFFALPLRDSAKQSVRLLCLAASLSAAASSVSATPTVTDPVVSSIGANEAKFDTTVTSLAGGRGLERGFVYAPAGTNPDPVLAGPGVSKVSKSGGTGKVTFTVTTLSPATTYAVKSFIRTNLATAYSNVRFFTTDTTISFTSGVGSISGRIIRAGDSQLFDLHIADSSSVVFSGSGASPSMTWELIDELGIVIASGSGNLSVNSPLAWGDYQLRIANPGATQETFALTLDISTLANPLPDISVGTDSNATSGVDIYGPPSLTQYAVTTTTLANPRELFFRIDNDGPLPDFIQIAASPSDTLFKVEYFFGGKNQTAAVVAGVARTGRIAADDAPLLVRAKISPNKKDSRIKRMVLVNGRNVAVYGSESFIGTMTVTASSDMDITDSAMFRLNTLP